MNWRRATPADRQEIERRLGVAPVRAMFPLSNLARYGMTGGHARAMSFWLSETDIFGLSDEGMAMPAFGPASELQALRASLRGTRIKGAVAPAPDARAFLRAMGLEGRPASLDRDEPQFVLELDRLRLPKAEGFDLVPFADVDAELLTDWRLAFGREALGWSEDARLRARRDIERDSAAGTHRALRRHGTPVAMTGFNATLDEIVQIGGVYVPPQRRRRGLGRLAVALHLDEARRAGVRRATLFAANENAARAYGALGFERCGAFTLAVFDMPATLT